MKSVIFDLDNTLYSYDRAHAKAYAAVARFAEQKFGIRAEKFDRLHSEAYQTVKHRCDGGAAIHNRLIRFQVLLETIGQPIGNATEMANLYWQTLISTMEAEPYVIETLQALREMGLRIGIGTNMTADWQLLKLERLGLLSYIDFLVSSEEAGAEKPDPRLFALCAEKSVAEPSECCFVGDHLEKDALAAHRAGMLGVWYCPAGGEAPEGVVMIRTLSELPALLKK